MSCVVFCFALTYVVVCAVLCCAVLCSALVRCICCARLYCALHCCIACGSSLLLVAMFILLPSPSPPLLSPTLRYHARHALRSLAHCRQVYLKLEFSQFTGSFKERGARNALMCLSDVRRPLHLPLPDYLPLSLPPSLTASTPHPILHPVAPLFLGDSCLMEPFHRSVSWSLGWSLD